MKLKSQFGPRQIIALFAIIALGIVAAVYGFKPKTFEQKIEKAEKYWKSKKYKEAIGIYLVLIEESPDHPKIPELLLQVGDIYNLSLNNFEQALKSYELVTIRFPGTPYALQSYAKKGEIFFSTGQFDKALKEYQNILMNFPNHYQNDQYRLQVGLCLMKLKQFEAARKDFKKILDQNPQTPLTDQIIFQIANSYFLEGNTREAIPVYEAFLKNYPDSNLSNEAKFNMADCYEDLGDFDKALKIYEEIKNTYPNPKVIELQIQKNKERRQESETRKADALADRMIKGGRMPTTYPQTTETKPSPKKISPELERKRKKAIEDIIRNY